MNWLRKIFAQMLTEANNSTLCPVRILGAVAVSIYHIAAAIGVAVGSIHIDMSVLGDYVRQMIEVTGTLAASVGAKSLMRADAAPPPPPQEPQP
jgi:hypothetical protein